MEIVVAIVLILTVLSLVGMIVIGVGMLWWFNDMTETRIKKMLWIFFGLACFISVNLIWFSWYMQH